MISVIFIEQDIHFSTWFSKLATSVERSVQWIGEAQTGAKGIELVRQHKAKQPLFVFLDVDLPDMSGEWICRYIHRHWPTVKCIFLINPLHWSTLSRLVGSPAQGFLTKYACYLCFEAIKVVNGGKTYLQPDLGLELLRYREKTMIRHAEKLSPGEYEVVMMLTKNKTYKDIVKVLHISLKTIYNLKASAYKKLGVDDIQQIRQLFNGDIPANLVQD